MEVISICLSDIPEEARTQANNGKIYANFVVAERKEIDKFGNNLTVYINQTKEEREAKKNKVYVGSGKAFNFNNQPTNTQTAPKSQPIDDGGDLPF